MRRVIVFNAKGGSGKTTVATNLAVAYATRGFRTAIVDYDPQASAIQWLRTRPVQRAPIAGAAAHEANRTPLSGAWQLKVPRDCERVVVDTPAGLLPRDLLGRIGPTDALLIPVLPSAIDMRATADFVRDLQAAKIRPATHKVGFLANRLRGGRTRGGTALKQFFGHIEIPVIAELRDTQHYVAAAETGLGVCEIDARDARKDAATWLQITDWLEQGLAHEQPAAAAAPAPVRESAREEGGFIPAFLQLATEIPGH